MCQGSAGHQDTGLREQPREGMSWVSPKNIPQQVNDSKDHTPPQGVEMSQGSVQVPVKLRNP